MTEKLWDRLVKGLAALCGAAAGCFGGFDAMLQVLVGMMAADYLTGLAAAWLGRSEKTETGHLDSRAGAKGIAKKGLMLLVVLIAAQLDRALGSEGFVFRNAVVWFYIANEGLSVLENLALANVPFPQNVKDALEQLKKKNDTP